MLSARLSDPLVDEAMAPLLIVSDREQREGNGG